MIQRWNKRPQPAMAGGVFLVHSAAQDGSSWARKAQCKGRFDVAACRFLRDKAGRPGTLGN